MVKSCGGKTIKYLVATFNILAFLAGLALLGACVAARFLDPVRKHIKEEEKIKEWLEGSMTKLNGTLYVGMAIGALIMVLAFLACCGALMENQCMLFTFSLLMLIILLVQFSVGIVIIIAKDGVRHQFEEVLEKAANDTNIDCDFWKYFQETAHCCGFNGTEVARCRATAPCKFEWEGQDCVESLWSYAKQAGLLAGIIMLVVLVLELLATIFAICLCCMVRSGTA